MESLRVTVEAEEEVYSYQDAANGSGPLWCFGATVTVRLGDDVFVSGWEMLPDEKPWHNARWAIYHRGSQGWNRVNHDQNGRTREPCPIACFPDEGRIFLSANPTKSPPGTDWGTVCAQMEPTDPHLVEFSRADPQSAYVIHRPVWLDGAWVNGRWHGDSMFNGISYRGLSVDGESGDLMMMNLNIVDTAQMWTLRDRNGNWVANGEIPVLRYHYGTLKKIREVTEVYEIVPHTIRPIYPMIQLRNRTAWAFCHGGSNESNVEWAVYKQSQGMTFPQVRRHLLFAWTPDMTTTPFTKWIELRNVEDTAGIVMNCDLWVSTDGAAHLLWTETSSDKVVRDRFLPGVPVTASLHYGVVRDGKLVSNQTLSIGGEGFDEESPGWGRFHVTPEGRLLVFYAWHRNGSGTSENRVLEIRADGSFTEPVTVPMRFPFSGQFHAANVRAGCRPSQTLDVVGTSVAKDNVICYARLRFE